MTIRGAISGFGEVAARAHLAGWTTRPDVKIVAVHEPIAARRHLALTTIRNVRVYDELELMLDGERLDFVDVASPPAFHALTAHKVLEAGAHVLVEKPLCLDAGAFADLAAMSQRNARVLMCVHNWKFAPVYRAAREIVESGRLGEVQYVALERLRTAPAGTGGGAGAKWRAGAEQGGGILIDHGWHVFYLMGWLMGGAAPVGVSAILGRAPGSAIDESADIRVSFAGGRIGYANLTWRSPIRRTIAVIRGTEAVAEIDGDRVRLTDRSGKTEVITGADPSDDSYHPQWFAGMAAEFEAAMLAGSSTMRAREALNEARAVLGLTLAAYESDRNRGSFVTLS